MLGSGAFAFQQETPENREEEVYLSFRYQGVIDEIIVAIAIDNEFYLPLTDLFELFAINYELSPSNFSVNGYYLSESNPYILDFANQNATISDSSYILDASDYLIKDVDFYVKPQIFEQVFGLQLIVDLSRLVLRLKTKDILPVISRHESRRAHQRRKQYAQVTDDWYPLVSGRQPQMLNGALLDYTLYSSITENNSFLNLNTNIGGELFYGDVQGNLFTTANPFGTYLDFSGFRWRYVNDKSPWFTRASVGAINSKGLSTRLFNGISVSNEPILAHTSYDQYIIDGHTDPEAEVELFQDNRLVEVVTADDIGYYRFIVPLNYGISRFKIRIYAKQGHVIEYDSQIDVPFNFLPPGEFRYQVSGGVQSNDDIVPIEQTELAQFNFSYGVNNWLSMKTGIDYASDENSDKPIIYNQISSRVGTTFLLNLDLVYGSFYKVTSNGHGRQSSSWNMDYTYFQKEGPINPLGQKQVINTGIFFPVMINKAQVIVRFDGGWQNYSDQNIYKFNLFLNNTYRGFRFRYGLKEEHGFADGIHLAKSSAHAGVVYSIPRSPLYRELLRGTHFRNDVYYSTATGQFESIIFQISKQFSKKLRAQLSWGEDFTVDDRSIEIGISWDAERYKSTSSLKHSNRSYSLAQTLRGSVGLDRAKNEFLWDNRQQVGRSGVSIRMFVDEDNSGAWDKGEEILPGNALSIKRATTRQVTQSGISRLTQLQPYRRYNFVVDEAKITNPLLLPRNKEFSVILDPNSFKSLDIPFFTTGIIDGRVDKRAVDALIPISGLRLHLRNEDGSYEATLRTFADGSFYSMEIPPGDYEIWIDETQLEFLQMNSVPGKLEFSVEASSDGDFIEELDFILE